MKRGLNFSLIIGAVLLFILRVAGAVEPEKVGLYLSFEQRLAASWALAYYSDTPENQSELFDMATKYVSKVKSLRTTEYSVRNFQEFLNHYKGDWPGTNSLNVDVKLVLSGEPRAFTQYTSKSARVQRQIDRYLAWQSQNIQSLFLGKDGVVQSFDLKDALLNRNSFQFVEAQLAKLGQVGEKLSQTAFAKIASDGTRISMSVILQEYFSRLSLDSKKLILSAFLGDNLLSTETRKFELMVQNSGPQFQKLLQVLTRMTGVPAELAAVFKVLESSVRPVPWVQVQKILESETKNYDFKNFEKKPLGIGTMAQVHRAKININDRVHSVVVRFIKPGIEARVLEDERILVEAAAILDSRADYKATGCPPLSPVIKDLSATVSAELNQNETIERQNLAQGPYSKKISILPGKDAKTLVMHVPKIFPGKGESSLMVQEMIFGKKLDKEVSLHLQEMPHLKKSVIEALVKVWTQEVFFGDGFFHSDLHQGNFLLRVDKADVHLNILDFGMGGRLSKELQAHVLLLGVATSLEDPKLLAIALAKISADQMKFSGPELENLIRKQIAETRQAGAVRWTLSDWTGWAFDRGLKLPYEFVNLNRGMAIMDTLLTDSGTSLEMTTVIKDLAVANPKDVLNRLIKVEHIRKRDLLRASWNKALESLRVYSKGLYTSAKAKAGTVQLILKKPKGLPTSMLCSHAFQ